MWGSDVGGTLCSQSYELGVISLVSQRRTIYAISMQAVMISEREDLRIMLPPKRPTKSEWQPFIPNRAPGSCRAQISTWVRRHFRRVRYGRRIVEHTHSARASRIYGGPQRRNEQLSLAPSKSTRRDQPHSDSPAFLKRVQNGLWREPKHVAHICRYETLSRREEAVYRKRWTWITLLTAFLNWATDKFLETHLWAQPILRSFFFLFCPHQWLYFFFCRNLQEGDTLQVISEVLLERHSSELYNYEAIFRGRVCSSAFVSFTLVL